MHSNSAAEAEAEAISLTVVPMFSAIVSFIGSFLIVVMMRRSKKKMKDAYRRIVFGMSMFDIASSLAVALMIFKSTPESDGMWLALGNQTSCDILGFLNVIGIVGAPMYSVNLNIYYYYLIKRNMREEDFKNKVEPWLHGVPFVFTISGGIYVWVKRLFNPSTLGECLIAPYPVDCSIDSDDDVECVRGENFIWVVLFYIFLPITLCLIISTALLVAIWWKVRSQEIRMDKYRIRRVTVRMRSSLLNNIRRDDNADNDGIDASGNGDGGGGGGLLEDAHRRVRNWLQRRREMRRTASNSRSFLWTAFWYGIAFFITFIFPYIAYIVRGSQPPFAIKLLFRSLQPLQGLFNILVYTRPHVKTYRDADPNLTWFQAFRRVVASGGDDDLSHEERRRHSRRRSALSRRSATGSSTRSLRGLRNSTMYSNAVDNNSLRRSSMFGPAPRRRSSRGDMFHVEVDRDLERMMKEKAICFSDEGDEAESLDVVTVEKMSHISVGGRRSFRLSLTSRIDGQSIICENDGAKVDAGTNNEMHEEAQNAKGAEIAEECVRVPIRPSGEDAQYCKDRRGSVTFAIEDDVELEIGVSNESL